MFSWKPGQKSTYRLLAITVIITCILWHFFSGNAQEDPLVIGNNLFIDGSVVITGTLMAKRLIIGADDGEGAISLMVTDHQAAIIVTSGDRKSTITIQVQNEGAPKNLQSSIAIQDPQGFTHLLQAEGADTFFGEDGQHQKK